MEQSETNSIRLKSLEEVRKANKIHFEERKVNLDKKKMDEGDLYLSF